MKTPTRKFARAALLVLATLGAARVFASDARDEAMKSLNLDSMHLHAKDFAFQGADGHVHHLKDFLGKPLILHVWASWCTGCAKELPQLGSLSSRWAKDGVGFLPVAEDEKKSDVTGFLSKLEQNFPVWIAVPSDQSKAYWAWGLPITYFIDSSGTIVARALGARDWSAVPEEKLKLLFQKP